MITLLLATLLFGTCDGCDQDATGAMKTAVFELTAVGVEKELVTTISDLLRIGLTECEKYTVIDKGTMIDTLGEDLVAAGMNEAVAYCDSLGAALAVIGHMTQLGSKIIVSVSLINKWTKKTVFTDKLTSASLEDLEMVIKRLGDALCNMEKAKSNVTVETVTEAEAAPRRRRESYHMGGLTLGYLFPMAGSYGKIVEGEFLDEDSMGTDIMAMPGFNVLYLYETPYYMAEMDFRWHWKDHYSASVALEFAGYRFLSLADFAPFVGIGVGMCWGSIVDSVAHHYLGSYTRVYTRTFNGLSFSPGGGIVLFRTYDFHFLVGLKYNIVLAEGVPNGFLFSFGITYKKSGGGGCCIGI